MSWYQAWKPYVPVAERRARAAAYAKKLAKTQKRSLEPIEITGRRITTTFWGQAWCDNLKHYSDFANRLPRGRTYVRNGSVIDLQINRGKVQAVVSGSEIYRVTIEIRTLAKLAWKQIKRDCSQSIASLLDLLQGQFDRGIMQRLTQTEGGLFPQPHEIEMHCTCPDWANLCKHLAATLYGVGARLDASPELLFTLRDVDHLELVGEAAEAKNLAGALTSPAGIDLGDQDLGKLFGIELESTANPSKPGRRRKVATSAPPIAATKSRTRDRTDARQPHSPVKRSRAKRSTEKRSGNKDSQLSKSKVRPKATKRPAKKKMATAKR